jgi:hypothetical protein
MYAVTIEPLNAIVFLVERPESDRWEIQEGVELDIPANYAEWPSGEERPEQVLCASTSNPKHYKVFKFSREIDRTEFRPTGKNFGGVYSRTAGERFVKALPAALALQAVPDDDEPPGATEEAIRAVKGGR